MLNRAASYKRFHGDGGFTLIELLITTAILGIIAFGLTGTVIRYLQDTADTQGRFSESHDVQFAAAYWQRDVASIGVRSKDYDDDEDVHSYNLLKSVNVGPACTKQAGTLVGRLAWSEFNSDVSGSLPTLITVTYTSEGSGPGGSAPFTLTRRKCIDGNIESTIQIANRLTAAPLMKCSGPGGIDCEAAGSNVPTFITLTLTAEDPDKRHSSSYTATLAGERRQS